MVGLRINNENIGAFELFVFDKDGTLIELYTYWRNMVELRAKEICKFYKLDPVKHKENLMFAMGVDLKNKRLRPEGPVGLLPRGIVQKAAEDYLAKLDYKDTHQECLEIFKKVDDMSLSLLDKFVKPIKGAVQLLGKIKKRKGKIAVATTDKTERAELAIKFLNIGGFVDCVVGADKVEHSKPAPHMLEFIGKELNTDPAESVMIGDAETDIQMGNAAGFKAAIAVLSGLTPKDALTAYTPYVVEDVSGIHVE